MKDAERGGPSLPQPTDARPSCRLGPDWTWTVPASESQIVGIPPFPSRTKIAGRDGARALEATTVEKQAYLGGWGRTAHGSPRRQNPESLGNGRFRIVRRTRNSMAHAPFRPQPRKTGVSPSCAHERGWPYAPRDRHAPPDGPMPPSSTNFVIQPEIPETTQAQQKQKTLASARVIGWDAWTRTKNG